MIVSVRLSQVLLLIASFTIALILKGIHVAIERPKFRSDISFFIGVSYIPFLLFEYLDKNWRRIPSGRFFVCCHYSATLLVIIIKMCIFIGWKFAASTPLLLAVFFALFLIYFALYIGNRYWKIDIPTSITVPEVLIIITYLITTACFVYHTPLGLPAFIPEGAQCSNQFACLPESSQSQVRVFMLSFCWMASYIYYKTYKVYYAQELLLKAYDRQGRVVGQWILEIDEEEGDWVAFEEEEIEEKVLVIILYKLIIVIY